MFDPDDTDTTDDATPLLMDAPPADDPAADDAAGNESDGADEKSAESDSDASEDEQKEGSSEDDKEDEDKEEGAPEEYADFEMPEDFPVDAAALDAFKPLAKELNLTQEEAQRLVNLNVENAQRWADQLAQQHIDQRVQWREDATTDEEFGGSGLQENLAVAKQAREALGTPALSQLLNETGLGDHPEVIRFFYRAGKAIGEHDLVNSGNPHKQGSFYDHPTSKPRD